MYFIGCDPDLHSTAFALIKDDKPIWVGVTKLDKELKDRDAVISMACQISLTLASAAQYCHSLGGMVTAATVEAQEIAYTAKSGKNPRDLLMIGHVAGQALYGVQAIWPLACLYFPAPQRWKGDVPKQIHQARIMTKLGWDYDAVGTKEKGYCRARPPARAVHGADLLLKSEWKHVNDAIGLALFAAKEYTQGEKLREFTSKPR